MTEPLAGSTTSHAAPHPGDPAGWYPDPSDHFSPPHWERYWRGDGWTGHYRRLGSGSARDVPRETTHSAATAGLVLSLCSVAAPALIWMSTSGKLLSGDAVSGLAFLSLVSCMAALAGLIAGIVGRHDGRGVLAIVVSILGGALSFLTFAGMALALAFGAMNAGL